MSNEIPLKYYDIVDEYSEESEIPVKDEERDPLAQYFMLLITRLTSNQEISENDQHEMAAEAGIENHRIDDVAGFLNQWGNE